MLTMRPEARRDGRGRFPVWVGVALVAASFASIMPLSHDEAFWLAITRKLETGARLYDGAIDNKPPSVFLVTYLLDSIPGSFQVARGLLVGGLIASVGALSGRLGSVLGSSRQRAIAVGLIAAAVVALQTEFVFSVELPALVALLASLGLISRRRVPPAAGLAALALAFDPRTVLLLPALVLFGADQHGWKLARRFAGWAGVLTVLGIGIVWFQPDLRYGLIELNLGTRTSAGGWRPSAQLAVALRGLLPLLVGGVLLRPAPASAQTRTFLAMALGSLAIGFLSVLPFDHYWAYSVLALTFLTVRSNSCISYGEIKTEYSTNPVVFDTTLYNCDIDQDLLTIFNLWNASQDIVNNDDTLQIANFFTSLVDAEQNFNPISDPSYFENTNPFQTVYARVENYYACVSVAQVQLITNFNPLYLSPFSVCDDIIVDGVTDFDLALVVAQIGNNTPQNSVITLYESLDNVFTEVAMSIGFYQNTIPYTQTIYAKIEVNGQCYALTSIDLEVLYTPLLEEDITSDNPIIYCLNTYPEKITLYGGVLNDSPSNYYYSWSTGENMSFIEINEPGVYSVTVTDPNGCSSSRNITVVGSNVATITDVLIEELSLNNSITILASGEGDYEYALDNSFYQGSNFFENVSTGFHTIYIRDKNNCGITSQEVAVLGFPKYFTPNGDSINDIWSVDGVNQFFNKGIIVTIFDRYGKLITSVSFQNGGWDGTINGYNLPSNDYWYIAKFPDGKEYRGHFALIR